ncbi:MAG: redoxin domain-containing protein, partial [Planctomycetes bacterium]|nr:redoxin domain-containing protein [Planctomycetota bacterium]
MIRNFHARLLIAPIAFIGIGFHAHCVHAQQDLENRFDQLDRDSDGQVTKDELRNPAIFKLFDQNADGVITRDEATKAAFRGRVRDGLGRLLGADSSEDAAKDSFVAKGPSIPSQSPIRQGPALIVPGDHSVGQLVRNFEFNDIDGDLRRIHSDNPSDLTVIAFTSTSCPISKKYLPTLVDLHRDFAPRGVRFVLVNCVASDKPEEMKVAASKFASPIEYALDSDGRFASHLSAMSTTDVFLLDRSYTVIYRGAIDDQYGFGYTIDTPRHAYLRDALRSGLDHRSVLVSATAAPGCALDIRSTSTPESDVTYHNQVARLIQRHCVECHRDGGVGPFRLDTYDDAVAHAAMIRQVVDRGIMPPWFAAPMKDSHASHASPWINDRSLSASEKRQLIAWLDNKMPAGDPQDSPAPRVFADGWTIGKPDAVFEFDQPMKIKATGTMPYQNITVDTHLEQDHWVQAIEIRPGNLNVVHHVLVFVQGSNDEDGPRDDAADERGGYWGVYVPGNSKLVYPEGYARRIPKGAKLRFQMHYTPTGTATEDSTRIGLIYAKAEPEHEVRVASVANMGFRIPAGANNHPVAGSIKSIPVDVQILAFLPHMHVRGKSARYELTSGGTTQTLLDVPHYDFNWQLLYRYAEPLSVKAGDALQYTAWYDNSSANPANPDPTKEVRWGPQTFDEMHLGYIEYIVPGAKPGEPNPLSPRNRIRDAARNALGGAGGDAANLGDAL